MHLAIRAQGQYAQPRVTEACQVPHLYLEESHVPQYLEIVVIDAKGLFVRLDSLGVIVGRAVEETVDVPADVGSF
jgi:hypothetical protein